MLSRLLSLLLGLAIPLVAQDLHLRGARVVTGTGAPFGAADLVVTDGRIAPPGSEPSPFATAAELRGDAVVVPGLVDAHGHLIGLGRSLVNVDLVGTRSFQEVIDRTAARARELPPGAWVIGRGWDQNDWDDTAFPTHARLSAAVSDRPVWLTRIDGHAALANARAMELAGVTRATPAPSGGAIHRDDDGEPTGVFIDRAMALVGGSVPEPGPAEIEEALLAAQRQCLSEGLTAVHDAGIGEDAIDILRRLHVEGRWRLRVHAMLPASETAAIRRGPWQTPDRVLQVRAVKAYADGALGSRGAALLEPYSDAPGQRGLLLTPRAELERIARLCYECGFQLCVHAIGDAANRAVLDVYEAVVPAADRARVRFRIEHAQVVADADFARFAALHVIPAMQPTHLTSDMPWAPNRLGPERIGGAYAWRRFQALGLPVPFGSDFPVERSDPRLGLFAACTTRATDGSGPAVGFRPDQRLDRLRALQGFTRDAAWAAFLERELGTLETGKLADFTVFDRDVLTCPDAELLEARVLLTVIGGRIAFAADGVLR
ncbi:MAG: amidohydrolase [Planctomycetes bacterium]|nr:amidohydrolase [Planctomycetota bacterium]